jgi:hypothetical protein
MAKNRKRLNMINSFDGARTPAGKALYVADRFIPSMPRLLPKGISNTNTNYWNH